MVLSIHRIISALSLWGMLGLTLTGIPPVYAEPAAPQEPTVAAETSPAEDT